MSKRGRVRAAKFFQSNCPAFILAPISDTKFIEFRL